MAAKFRDRQPLPARRRSAAGHRKARRRLPRRPAAANAARARPGTGKTFTAANVIANIGKPTLVLSHNKTLAAQLYKEFRGFFPRNAVHYFVSYYDYYQPEAYIPQRDIYIEKDALINENIDRLRLAATSALVSREDVIIVASVSCIYGLGSPSDYKRMMVRLAKGETVDRDDMLLRLVDIQYQAQRRRLRRAASSACAATSSRSGRPHEEFAFRIELFGDEVDALAIINPTSGETLRVLEELYIYPAKHFVTPGGARSARPSRASAANWRNGWRSSSSEGKLLEAQRLGGPARASTWRCCWKSATVRASRITPAGSAAASRASRPTRCSTSSPTIS